jgi:hypothetical protein
LVAIRYSQARTRRPPLELLEAAPRGEQRLLEQVLGVLHRPDDPIHVQLELTPVRVGELAERVLVARTRTGQGPLGHARILSLTRPSAAITHVLAAFVEASAAAKTERRISSRQDVV